MKARAAALLAAALLLLGAEAAGAFAVGIGFNPCNPNPPFDECLLTVGDTVTANVYFDTEGALDSNYRLIALGVGVGFDNWFLRYDQSASSAQYYALGSVAPGNDLIPFASCQLNGSYPTYGPVCGLHLVHPPYQVQLEFVTSALSSLGGVVTNSTAGGNLIASLVFRVIRAGDGRFVELLFSVARSSSLLVQTRATSTSPWTYEEVTPRLVPEPATGVLIGLGLAGIGIAYRRPRSEGGSE